MADRHAWTFFRAGGVDQVVLKGAADLQHLDELDQKLWVALACPTKGVEIDARSLELVDADGDGRIRPPEIIEAIQWCAKVVKSLDLFFEKGATLPLDKIDAATDEGKAVLASAKRILADQDKKGAKTIELDDVSAVEKSFASTKLNGDGVVPPSSADEPATVAAIEDVMKCVGSVMDRSGKPGIDAALAEAFFAEADALLAWDAEGQGADARPLGDKTVDAAAALDAVETKIVDYFTRTRLAAFDNRSALVLSALESDFVALSTKILSAGLEDVARLPIAKIEPGRAMPLEAGVNPAWLAPLATFAKQAATPVLGTTKSSLTEADFDTIVAKLAGYRAWKAKKPTNRVDVLGLPRLRELIESGAKASIFELVARDVALQAEYLEIVSVEKAIRLRRDLVPLLRNFVNFAEFYGGRGAMFQAGTLYLDARSCELCLYVEDPAKHAALAGLSKAYLAYCDISRKSGERERIVAAFTAGDVDNLMVGRNGVFYDRKGGDWDATITSIVENPISVRQAFWSPYKRLVRLIEEQVAKRAAEKEKASTAQIDAAALAAGTADQKAPPTPPGTLAAAAPPAPAPAPAAAPPPPAVPEKKVDIGVIVGIGVAIGAIAGFFATVLAMFLDLGVWMPLGVLALLLAISGPSMLIAWLKLRQRNLGPILDASGWAVNGLAKINVPFGGSLTNVAKLPPGASRTPGDPFAEKPSQWRLYLFLSVLAMLLLLWLVGTVDEYIPEPYRFKTIIHKTMTPAPSAAPSSAPSAAAPAAPPAK